MKSKTAIETFNTCPRMYKYKYVDGWLPTDPYTEDSARGVEFHRLAEHYYRDGVILKSEDPIMNVIFKAYTEYEMYDQQQHVEYSFKLPDLDIKGVFDLVIEGAHETFPTNVIDHKLVKHDMEYADWYFESMETSWQAGIYQLAAREIWGKPAKFTINAVRYPQLKRGKKESEEDFCARVEENIKERPGSYFRDVTLQWDERDLDILAQDVKDTSERMKHEKLFPRARTCIQYKEPCKYLQPCLRGATFEDNPKFKRRES